MSQFVYRAAGGSGWLAAVMPDRLLVVHPRAADVALSVFEQSPADSVAGFQSALDALTRNGLSSTPAFALLEWTGSDDRRRVRVIVRGGVQAVVSVGDEKHTLDGTGVSTWTEQSFSNVTGFEVQVVAAADEGAAAVGVDAVGVEAGHWLPIERGVALVSRIASGAGTPVAVTTPPAGHKLVEPAPSAEPEAASEPAPEGVSEATMVDFPPEPESAEPESAEPEAAEPEAAEPEAAEPEAAEPAAEATLNADARPTDDGYDYLFGETMYRNVAEAAVREPEPDEEGASTAEPPAGDHDGMTIMTGDLKKLRAGRKARAAEAPPAPPAAELYLHLSTGSREALSQPVLVGRAPTANKVSGGALPRLVTIPGDKDISRNHAQFAVEGGTVVVTDLHSRNGTQVIMPGRPPQQLRQGEPTAVIVGTVVDLGGGVTLTVREEA